MTGNKWMRHHRF